MKKIIATLAAVSMLALSLAGCTSTTVDKPEETTATEETTVETTVEETTVPEETTVAETTGDLQEIVDTRADGIWTNDLINHINAAETVLIDMSFETEGVTTSSVLAIKDGKTYMSVSMGGAPIVGIFDGEYQYSVDDDTKTFSKEASTATAEDNTNVKNLGMEEAPTELVSFGIENLEGTDYICEEFNADMLNDDGTQATVKFYYDYYAQLVACAQTVNGELQIVWINIDFENVPDSYFEIPSDYKEISSDEMEKITLQKIMGVVAAATEE